MQQNTCKPTEKWSELLLSLACLLGACLNITKTYRGYLTEALEHRRGWRGGGGGYECEHLGKEGLKEQGRHYW